LQRQGLGEGGALVLNYYQPWTYAGSERFVQLAREELRQARSQAFVYVADAGLRSVIDRNVRLPEYAKLALYEFAPPMGAIPISPHAVRLSGPSRIDLTRLVEVLAPDYVRSHFPAADFVEALDTPEFRRFPFVYDIMDLWDEFAATPWGDHATEKYYVERADVLLAVSQLLVDRFSKGAKSHLVPNAIDRRFLREIAVCDPYDLRAPKEVLYMGSMGGSWFDWDLLRLTIEALPDHRFTLLGSARLPPEELNVSRERQAHEHMERLGAMPNVRVVPEVPHDELVPWLRRADVGLIPFLPNELVAAVSPLKVYEYLGAGAVVVQIGMPDIASFPGVRTAHSAADFVEYVRVSDRRVLSARERLAVDRFAVENTWEERLAAIDRIVSTMK